MASGTVYGKVGTSFPFAAVVGQPKVKKALECALVSKRIGSVLLMGPAGTAKTTMVRALDGLVPDVKIINLPLNATEEQIVGGLDLEAALKDGRKEALPGLLQRASGNILYVDDINLLSERLIYDIMEVALRKQSIVEREGISLCQECDFLLIGTMDPEEGMLSQHLLDRFDLCVSMSRLDDVEERMEILRRGLSYEFDPILFSNRYQESMDKMRDDIKKAQEKAQCVFIPNGLLDMIARLCQDLGVQGHRGDIALAKTAMSIAALNDRDQVILSDLEEAAPLCLEHRRHDSSDPKPPEPPKQRIAQTNRMRIMIRNMTQARRHKTISQRTLHPHQLRRKRTRSEVQMRTRSSILAVRSWRLTICHNPEVGWKHPKAAVGEMSSPLWMDQGDTQPSGSLIAMFKISH